MILHFLKLSLSLRLHAKLILVELIFYFNEEETLSKCNFINLFFSLSEHVPTNLPGNQFQSKT